MAEPRPFWDKFQETWPVVAARTAYDSYLLPGQLNAGILNVEPETPGMWSDVDEAKKQATEHTAFERTQDLGGLAMTGGMPFGPSGVTLTSGFKKPPLIGGYHGTGAPTEFEKFKASPRDLGTHFTIDPHIAQEYAFSRSDKPPSKNKARTYPVVGDIQNTFKFPVDPVKWNDPDMVVDFLEQGMRQKPSVPLALLRDIENIAKQPGGLQKNLIPSWQEKGFDSVLYPHSGYDMYNSLMVLDPKKVLPKYHPEAQALIKERGIHPPPTLPEGDWDLPAGVLKKYAPIDPGQEKVLAIRNMNKQKATAEKMSELKDVTEKYHAGQADLGDYKKAYDKAYGAGNYDLVFGDKLPSFLSPAHSEVYNLSKEFQASKKMPKVEDLPATDIEIKTWGLRSGATFKDVQDAINKWNR